MIRIWSRYRNKVDTDITSFCKSVQWSGDVNQCARKLEVTIAYSIFDRNQHNTQISPGSLIWVIDDIEGEIFRGIVFNREISSSQQELRFTAYDFLIYLLKSKSSYNFHNVTPEFIARTICGEAGVGAGNLAATNIRTNLVIQNQSYYDTIMRAYTEASKVNGKQYISIIQGLTVDIIEKGKIIVEDMLLPEKDIVNSSYNDGIDNMINRVKIFSTSGSYMDKVENSYLIDSYGVLQDSYTKEDNKAPRTVAMNMLHGVDRNVSTEVLGNIKFRTGYAVRTKIWYVDILENAIMYIDSDTHTWEVGTGKYTTQLTLHFENKMDAKEG